MAKSPPHHPKPITLTAEAFALTPQQALLRDVMEELNFSRGDLAKRMGCSTRTLGKWLHPESEGAQNYRKINETIRNHLKEIIEHERLKRAMEVGL